MGRPSADKQYLQRVWLNLWIKSGAQAFDLTKWGQLEAVDPIPDGAFVVAGFDGARFRDSTGIVLTDITTGRQQLWATWERPVDSEGRDVEDWEIPESEVTAAWEQIVGRFELWKAYCDPPHWTETVGSWAARWPDQFEEWWTNRVPHMARATRAYKEAILSGAVTHVVRPGNETDAAFDRHIAAAGRDGPAPEPSGAHPPARRGDRDRGRLRERLDRGRRLPGRRAREAERADARATGNDPRRRAHGDPRRARLDLDRGCQLARAPGSAWSSPTGSGRGLRRRLGRSRTRRRR